MHRILKGYSIPDDIILPSHFFSILILALIAGVVRLFIQQFYCRRNEKSQIKESPCPEVKSRLDCMSEKTEPE